MKKKTIIILSFICLFNNGSFLFSQKDNFILIEKGIQQFDIDFFGNFYCANNNVLKKYNKDFELLSNYDNKKYGKISQIDVSNPFIILLFYNASNTIVFLDNTLSEVLSPINLDEVGFYNSDIICNSQKGFWIFDYQKSSVFKLNHNLEILQQSNSLFGLVENKLLISMKESNNYLLIRLEDGTILIFDKFANYIKKIFTNQNSIANFEAFNDNIFFISDDDLVIYDIILEKETRYALGLIPKHNEFKIFNNDIFFLDNERLIKKELKKFF